MAKEKLTEQQYEEFDYITDFYMPIKEVEDKYNSPTLKRLRDAKIDAYEYLGLEKVEGVGEIKKIEDKTELAEAKKTAGQHLIDFAKDFIPATITETQEAGANVLNNVVQLFGFGSNMMFKGTKFDEVSQTTTEFAQGYNKGTEEFIAKLNKYKEENDVNGASELVNEIGIDIAAFVPINKMLKKAGVPDKVSTPLAFGLAWGFTGGDDELEKSNMFIDSEVIHGVNELLGILPDTPESEVAELVGNTFEGTIWGGIGDQLVRVFKIIKNNVPAFINQQTATAVGGSAIAGSATMELQEQTPDLNVENPDLEQEKKTLNFEEQEQISSPMPGDDEMASAGFGPVFKSIVRETAKKLANKGTGEQMYNTLKNSPGVKSSELKWTGLDDFLKGKKSVTKKEVKDYLEKNSLDVSEIQLPRVTKEAEEIKKVLDSFKKDGQSIYDEVGNLPMYQGRMQNFKEYTLTNILEDGTRVNEGVSARILDDNFIGKRIQTYMPPIKDIKGNRDYINLKKLSDDYGKKGDPDTLEFYVFENDKTGDIIAYPKSKIDGLDKFGDPFAGGQFVFTNKTEMNIKEAEKLAFNIAEETLQKSINVLSPKPKFSGPGYVEPGGKDYKELIFKLKGDKGFPLEKQAMEQTGKLEKTSFPYRSPALHFGTKNEFAHVRFKTRDLNGQKVLSVEEMQSDIVQDMKKNFGERVTDFPFKNTWYELVTKRLIRYAADNGFDAVAIPKGSTIASRYKQTTDKVFKVNVQPKLTEAGTDPSFVVTYFGAGNRQIVRKTFYEEELIRLEKEIGTKNYSQLKDNIDNFIKNRPTEDLKNTRYFADFDKPLILGSGKGKAELYDKAIPSFMKKYGKKWNAKVYDDELDLGMAYGSEGTGQMPVTIIKLTPEMKKAVQTDGQALFSIFGLGGVGASVVSDSIKNNTISNQTIN